MGSGEGAGPRRMPASSMLPRPAGGAPERLALGDLALVGLEDLQVALLREQRAQLLRQRVEALQPSAGPVQHIERAAQVLEGGEAESQLLRGLLDRQVEELRGWRGQGGGGCVMARGESAGSAIAAVRRGGGRSDAGIARLVSRAGPFRAARAVSRRCSRPRCGPARICRSAARARNNARCRRRKRRERRAEQPTASSPRRVSPLASRPW